MDEDRTLIAEIVGTAHANGLTQKILAARSGITEETLSRMKKRGSGNLGLVVKLARAAGTRLGLVDSSAPPRRTRGPVSFRDKYAVALAWSNKDASDEVLIRRALVKPRFQLLLDAAVEFGVNKLSSEWERLKAEGSSEALNALSTTERMLRHIHDGYRQAAG
ncbi:MAG: hypothetical protein BroJett038_23750 [Chloroflexota bacterium]|jgi:transcriptional regulator with XRE-family HTH domain|nr:MAG: hypothetical protein BroJett038_23750 [Chloroflexota bacterium]